MGESISETYEPGRLGNHKFGVCLKWDESIWESNSFSHCLWSISPYFSSRMVDHFKQSRELGVLSNAGRVCLFNEMLVFYIEREHRTEDRTVAERGNTFGRILA